MHNNIMAACSRDHPPMLATGRYPQWRSRFLRYIDTRPNGEALRKCILSGLEMKYTRLLMLAKQLRKCGKLSNGYDKKQFDYCYDASQCSISSTTSARMVKEVNELHIERLAKNANPLALVATTQVNQEPYYQTSKSHKSCAPSSKPSIPTRSLTTTRHKGKEIAKPITPPSETTSEEDNDLEQAQMDKDMQRNLALIAKYFKKIYKPTNNNLRISSTQGTRMWIRLHDTDEEVDEQELKAYYSYMTKIQEVPTADTCIDSEPLEQVQNDAGYNVFANDLQHSKQSESNDQNDVESDDERVALDNLIANLKLDVDENKKIQKQLKKANTTLAQELKECKVILAETKIDELESDKAEFSNMYDVILLECVSNDVKCSYLQSLSDLDALAELQCLYLHKVKECDCLAQKLSKQTESVSKEFHTELLQCFAKVEKHSISLEIALKKRKEQVKHDTVWNEKASNGFRKEREQYFKIQDLKAQLQDKNIAISKLKNLIEKSKGKSLETKFDKPFVIRQPSVLQKPTPFSNSLERIYFLKTKSVLKTNVSEGLSKLVTAQTLPQTVGKAFVPSLGYGDLVQGNVTINRVYYVKGLNHNLFSVGQFCDADLEVAFRKSTCFVRDLQGNDLLTGNRRSDLCTVSLQESTSSTPLCLMAKASSTQAWLWHRRLSH
nr:retrovirus-related Pol polyprotein from transposon TNT 1-94 [Tanacetum cinerariifolium]